MLSLYQLKFHKIGNANGEKECNSCPTLSILSPIPSKFSLISLSNGASPKRRLPMPSCLSRQDSNAPASSGRHSPEETYTRICSTESGRSLTLTDNDLMLIKTTWDNVPEKILWCQRLFLKLFSTKDQMKKLMGYDGLSAKELMNYQRFENHCVRFIDFWQTLIDLLCCNREDNTAEQRMEKLVNKIREIGYMHCQMPGVTFDAESWLHFKNLILESLYVQQSDVKERRLFCWSKFIGFVIGEMKDAFHQGVRARSHTF